MARRRGKAGGGKPPGVSDYVSERQISAARADIPGDGEINALAETFRALSDPTRVRIVAALSRRELCVRDLAELLGLTASAISHQLRLLRGQRLVRYQKRGKMAYYMLDDDHIENLFQEGRRHIGD